MESIKWFRKYFVWMINFLIRTKVITVMIALSDWNLDKPESKLHVQVLFLQCFWQRLVLPMKHNSRNWNKWCFLSSFEFLYTSLCDISEKSCLVNSLWTEFWRINCPGRGQNHSKKKYFIFAPSNRVRCWNDVTSHKHFANYKNKSFLYNCSNNCENYKKG